VHKLNASKAWSLGHMLVFADGVWQHDHDSQTRAERRPISERSPGRFAGVEPLVSLDIVRSRQSTCDLFSVNDRRTRDDVTCHIQSVFRACYLRCTRLWCGREIAYAHGHALVGAVLSRRLKQQQQKQWPPRYVAARSCVIILSRLLTIAPCDDPYAIVAYDRLRCDSG
jgi:hypothetical protein